MEKNSPFKRIPTLAVILALVAVLLGIGGSLAIYSSQAFQRSVVRNRDTESIRFSSDKLYRVVKDTPPQKYYYPLAQNQHTMTFRVCNYDQTKRTVFSEKNIDYTITFQLKNASQAPSFYSVTSGNEVKSFDGLGALSFTTHSLRGARPSSIPYTFTFHEEDYGQIELTVTVTPSDKDLSTTKHMILNGILIPIQYASTQGLSLRHEFIDSKRDTPDQFSAYNLLVSISGGKSDSVRIAWDCTKLDIDPFFLEGKTVTHNSPEPGWNTVTFPMNSEDATGAYLIPFYNHNNSTPAWTTWAELSQYIKVPDTL